MIEIAFLLLAKTVVMFVIGRNEAGAHLKKLIIVGPPVIENAGIPIFVIGDGHGPAGHLQ